ncbi:MAG TPA: ACT domain-containing protein [Sphingomicrobium sp.]|nr:ACT domain-containing protein [Sphingomicrobium sp.]
MTNQIAHTLGEMLAGLSPNLSEGSFLFVTLPTSQEAGDAIDAAIGCFREDEGQSLIMPREAALALGFADGPPMRHIVLRVHSSLEGVGLTAAVAGRLADHGIACNVVAAYHHDHLFVPAERAEEALRLLNALQREAR